MKTPIISVIIPAFNEEKYIGSCLESLVNQRTSISYEIILVDNNSSDKTSNIGKKYKVRLLNEKRRGRPYARQRGVDSARGKILAFTEADCIVPSDWIEQIAQYFETHLGSIGFSGSYRYINAKPLVSFLGPLSHDVGSMGYKLFRGNHTFRGSNFAVLKSTVKEVGGFNPKAIPFDDIELGLRSRLLGPIGFIPSIIIKTSDRRQRKRFFTFLRETYSTYFKLFILKQKVTDDLYPPIR